MQQIRVVLVDDHEVVRLGLKWLLESDGGFQVVGEAATAGEAIEVVRKAAPDLVVMDVRLPDSSGVEACREIRSGQPEVKVLMLTSYSDEEATTASLLAGASGYLLKKVWSQDLINSLKKVYSGESILDPSVTGQVIKKLRYTLEEESTESEQLTRQEKKVLALIAEAKTNREIAQALYLSEKTVRNYVSNVFRKLNFEHRSQAVLYASRVKGL